MAWRHWAMKITCTAVQTFSSTPAPIFDLMVDAAGFPACFDGFGLIPAIRSIRLAEPLAVGVIRHIHNADNSVLSERVTVVDKPHRHAYILSGFQAPFSWLVRKGEADWRLSEKPGGTEVSWTYQFTLTSALVFPICFLLLKFFMQQAMRRCLANMDQACGSNKNTD